MQGPAQQFDRDLFGEPIVERPKRSRSKANVIQLPLERLAPPPLASPPEQTSVTKLDAAVWRSKYGDEVGAVSYAHYSSGPTRQSPFAPLYGWARSQLARRVMTSLKFALMTGVGAAGLGADAPLPKTRVDPRPAEAAPSTQRTTPSPKRKPVGLQPRMWSQKDIDAEILKQLQWRNGTSAAPVAPPR